MEAHSELVERVRQLSPAQRATLARRLGIASSDGNAAKAPSKLVAYYETGRRNGSAEGLDVQIRRHLQAQLPSYMVPHLFVEVEQLPRLPNGKVDRKALLSLVAESVKPRQDDAAADEAAQVDASPSEMERQLVEIVADVIGCGMVHVDDSFFEVGGDSLLAMQVVSRAHQQGIPITIQQVMDLQTVAKMAAACAQPAEPAVSDDREGDSNTSARLVTLQNTGSRPNLYFIHTLGEGFEYCRALLPHLGSDQPVHGISTLVDGARLPEGDVMPYYRQLKRHQPHGPYYLVGIFCGGRSAFKLACYLRSQGEEVALLAMVHTLTDLSVFRQLSLPQRLAAHWRTWSDADWGHRWRRLARIVQPLHRGHHKSLSLEEVVAQRTFRFEAEPFDGRITMFRLSDMAPFIEPELGWHGIAQQGVAVHPVPGNWMDLFQEPYVRELGTKLRDVVEAAPSS